MQAVSKSPPVDLLSAHQVAQHLGVSVRTVWRMVNRGELPPPLRFNCKLVRWRAGKLLDFLDALYDRLEGY